MVALCLCAAACEAQRHASAAAADTAVYEQVGILTHLTATEASVRSYGLDGKGQQSTFVLKKDAVEGTVHVSQVVRVVYQRNGAKLVASKLTATGAGGEPRNASPSLGIYGTASNVPHVYVPGDPPLVRAAYDPSEPVSSGLPMDAVRPEMAELIPATRGPRTLSSCMAVTDAAVLPLDSSVEFFVVADGDDAVQAEGFSLVVLGASRNSGKDAEGKCQLYEIGTGVELKTTKVSDRVYSLKVGSALRPGWYAFLAPVKEKTDQGSVVAYSFIVLNRKAGAFGNIEADAGEKRKK